VGEPISFAEALRAEQGWGVAMADGAGGVALPRASGIRLLVGPEGGWSDAERDLAREAGVGSIRLGPLTMRIEVAAVVGAALLLAPGGPAGGL
jgi:16S rRNA (uracil1498-N3)-methyltransferase